MWGDYRYSLLNDNYFNIKIQYHCKEFFNQIRKFCK